MREVNLQVKGKKVKSNILVVTPMKAKQIIIFIIIGVVVAGGIYFFTKANNVPGKLDAFAQCLKTQGATFYGAFWCPHCQNQKKMFGSSEKYLPYVECSSPSGNSQLLVCNEKNIAGYPTWEFADKSRETGEVPLQTLSEKTGCALPK